MAIAINMVSPLNAQLPEEASFRGWAQPKLQSTRTPLAATVWMAIGVTIWHIPLVVMPQFGPIETLATVAVTFWYAWLFNHASGSALLTLIAHATNGTIETSTLWPAGADTTRMFGSRRWSGACSLSACWCSTVGSGLNRQERSTTSIMLVPGMDRGCDMHPEVCSTSAAFSGALAVVVYSAWLTGAKEEPVSPACPHQGQRLPTMRGVHNPTVNRALSP
jgi:hypothetical protein